MSTDKDKKSSLFNADRFAEERERLEPTQESAALKCGVSREMWGKYERGQAVPGSNILLAFAALGADLQYISSGNRSGTGISSPGARYLTKQQEALLDNFEHCPKGVQEAIAKLALAIGQDDTDVNNQTQKSA